MKPDLLRGFIEWKKGVENCVRLLTSHRANVIALDFVRLVRTAHSHGEDDDAEMDLSEQLEYRNLLLKAFRAGDYKEVEEHIMKALNIPEEMEDVQYTGRVIEPPNQFAEVFKSQYNGTAAEELHRHLGELHSEFVSHEGRYYAKYCSIVQSSGTGKSRALIELKKQDAIVVYINIRSKDDNGNPFPDRDEVPADILTKDLKICSEKDYSRRCTAMLTALLQVLKRYLLELRGKHSTREELVKAWSERMCDMGSDARSQFFAGLAQAYQEIREGRNVLPNASTVILNATDQQLAEKKYPVSQMTPSSSAEHAPEQDYERDPQGNSKETPKETPKENPQKNPEQGPTKPPRVYGVTAMKRAYDELIGALPEIFETSSNSPGVVVAIDEAHPLCDRDGPFSPSHILTRVISALSLYRPHTPFWFVFASTASKVADFSAPADLHASSRINVGGKRLFPPYYELGWDQHVAAWETVEPENVAQFAHIVQTGRPLWCSLVKSGLDAHEVLRTAAQKLCGQLEFKPQDRHPALAVVGQRFLLTVCLGSHGWVQFHQTGVSSHLRVCRWVSEDRTLLDTIYPSEPLLSCAAARLLYPTSDPTSDKFFTTIGEALNQLATAVVDRTIDKGLTGELVSRLVLLIGKDVAIRTSNPTPTSEASTNPSLVSGELLDCKPLPVARYLAVLFGEGAISREDLDVFDGWYINFSHWIGMVETFAFTEGQEEAQMKTLLLLNWKRSSALQCHHDQSATDKVIPMYKLRRPSESREGRVQSDWVSFILVQDKNRNRRIGTFDVNKVTPQHAGLSQLIHPYIAIVADHGIPEKETVAQFYPNRNALVIHATGFGPSTYPFLKGIVVHHIRNILGASHLGDRGIKSEARKDLEKQVGVGESSIVGLKLE